MWSLSLSPTCPCRSLSTFSTLLPASTWATFMPPSWLPSPAHLTQLAKVMYTYWRERRTEQGGHRIISTLDYDETGSQNESYICFRHRKIRAICKTRASQITSSVPIQFPIIFMPFPPFSNHHETFLAPHEPIPPCLKSSNERW